MSRRTHIERSTTTLASAHGWRVRPNHKLLVLDRGAVRLEFPDSWVVHADHDSVKLHDKEPPDDGCVLAVSYHRWPPAGNGLAVGSLVRSVLEHDSRSVTIDGSVVEENKIDIALAWAQAVYTDPGTNHRACTRLCLARKAEVEALLTFDFWASDLAKCDSYWRTFIATLELAQWIDDPRRGPLLA